MNRENLITEMWVVLDIISAEFRSDPSSTACFDLGIVERANDVVKNFADFANSPGVLPVVNPAYVECLPDPPQTFDFKTIIEPVVIKTVPELLKEKAETYAMEYLWRNEPAAMGMDRLELRHSDTFSLDYIFIIDGYLAGYEDAENSIRAELKNDLVKTKIKKTKSKTKTKAKKASSVSKNKKVNVRNKRKMKK